MLTITEVEVNRDMEFAKVYFTTLGGEAEHAACLQGLQRASGTSFAAPFVSAVCAKVIESRLAEAGVVAAPVGA